MNAQLKLSREEMQALGYRVVDMIVEHYENVSAKPVARVGSRAELEEKLCGEIPHEGENLYGLLKELEQTVFTRLMHLDHPRYFGSVPSPGNFVSVMADALAAGFNVFAGTWAEASGPAQIETTVTKWLCQLCGMPDTAGGVFVGGGSVANLTALAVARKQKLGDQSGQGVVYASEQAHSSIERAVRILGLTQEQFVKIPTDKQLRMSFAQLREEVKKDRLAGRRPFCVVATAGTTNSAAVDPLSEVAAFCRQEGLWLHVDGAYGAPAIITDKGKELLAGLGEADSLTIDPHKWLFQPYEASCILVREASALKDTFYILPEYLQDFASRTDEVNFCDYGIQLTRSFKALKVWLSLKAFGLEHFRQALDAGMQMAEKAGQILMGMPGWEVVTVPQLGMLNFRYAPKDLKREQLNRLNGQIVQKSMQDGFALFSSTVLHDQTVIHMCTINPRTTEEDVEESLSLLNHWAEVLAKEY